MKKFASIAVVVALLLAAAIYYGNLNKPAPAPSPDPDPVVTKPKPKKGPVPQIRATADGTLKLTAATSHGYIKQGDVSELYGVIDIDAIKHEGGERPPLNVAVVIDRSGSMAGAKIRHAKQAAHQLVDVLDEGDRIAIVSYGSDVTVDFSSRPVSLANRASMRQAINNIAVSGGTNLSGGYQKGLSEVQRFKGQDTINRVILMSDGNANIGVTYLPELERMASQGLGSGVSMSSIGVGLDYNEDLMTAMANQGAGNYYFVDDTSRIAAIFTQELKSLAASVARNTALVIKLAPGVSLGELYGFPYRESNGSLMISLAEFSSEQSKNVLMKLNVPGDAQGKRAILDAQLSYTDLLHDSKARHQQVSLHSVATDQADRLEEAVDASVIARVQQVDVAQSMQQAMKLYEKGEAEQAAQVIERQQRRTRSARKRYKIKDDSFDRVDTEMSSMNKAMRSNSSGSAEGRKLIKKKKARSNYILFDEASF